MMSVKTECNKPLNGLCKNILFGSLVTMALIAATGCSGTDTGAKSAKCGGGKCGGDKKAEKAMKCGADKKADKGMKCAAGKCGGDKK